ncbi:MAG: histone deacetylase family protein [Candidatus Odinarchaeia archaeon]
MAITGLVYSDEYLKHNTGLYHPERKERLLVIMEELKRRGILDNKNLSLIQPVEASIENIQLIHVPEHIERIREFCQLGGGPMTPDTIASAETFKVALLAVGGALTAAEKILNNEIKNAFALVRPPGHHATRSVAQGFCFFNNIAILAEYLHKLKNFSRILILDVDVHHGNGTQDIFYDKNYVLYFGMHQDGRTLYPGTGFINEIGVGEGEGYNINIPLPPGTGSESYLNCLKEIFIPVVDQYKPEIILVSWGFDAHFQDNIAALELSSQCFGEIAEIVLASAEKYCNGNVIALLEGGYSLSALPRCAYNVISSMLGLNERITDDAPEEDSSIKKYVGNVLNELKKKLSAFWNF